MATKYVQVDFDISPMQKKNIARAINSNTNVKLRLTNRQLQGDEASMLVTPRQAKQIEKAKSLGKGIILTLSTKQLEKMKTGGFLPVLLGALVSSLAPTIFNRIFPSKNQDGEGINLPKGRGVSRQHNMDIPQGMIIPYNGTNTTPNIEGYSARNGGYGAGINMPRGNGIMLPGGGAGKSSKTAKVYAAPKSGMGMKKKTSSKRQTGMSVGYVAPNSEKYQMLE